VKLSTKSSYQIWNPLFIVMLLGYTWHYLDVHVFHMLVTFFGFLPEICECSPFVVFFSPSLMQCWFVVLFLRNLCYRDSFIWYWFCCMYFLIYFPSFFSIGVCVCWSCSWWLTFYVVWDGRMYCALLYMLLLTAIIHEFQRCFQMSRHYQKSFSCKYFRIAIVTFWIFHNLKM
jgi:hypothetical protein